MAEYLENAIKIKFDAAAEFLPSLISTLNPDKLLEFYALYKQATVGECNDPCPSWFAYNSKRKWEAWKALGDLSQIEAMFKYISLIEELMPDWEDYQHEKKSKNEAWVAVSRMSNEESQLNEEDKTVFDWVKEGNLDKVKSFVEVNGTSSTDEFGMSLLHWASDRGLVDVVKLLISQGADINMRDGTGQTALHYACCCGHPEVVKTLISNSAKTDLSCEDGFTPYQLASDDIKSLF